jgi:CRP-like cAMP-binding protein
MTQRESGAPANRLLASLNGDELDLLRPELEPVGLERGAVLLEAGERLRHVYFPTTAIVALLCGTRAGESSAIALTGCEGLVGASVCMGSEIPATSAVVLCEGACLRAPVTAVRDVFARGGSLHALTLRSVLDAMVQVAQCAVCNRHHRLDQQLCRWLLMTHDRSVSDLLYLTQEEIASLLGVRREGVSHAASRLEAAGLIQGKRGRIRMVDRAGLELQACECYGIIRAGTGFNSNRARRDAVLGHEPVQRHAGHA